MLAKSVIINISVLLALITNIFAQFSSCDTYTCDNTIGANVCQAATSTGNIDNFTNSTIFNYRVNICTGNNHCSFMDGNTANITIGSLTSFKCVNSPTAPGSMVDGEPCQINADCASSVCTIKNCTGFALNASCIANNQCKTGLYCELATGSGTCLPQKSTGSPCTLDLSCANTAGCYNNTCTPLYSLSPLTYLGAGDPSFCSTYNAYMGRCVTMFLQNLTEPRCFNGLCVYNVTEIPAVYYFAGNCVKSLSNSGYYVCGYGNEAPMALWIITDIAYRSRGCQTTKRTYCRNLMSVSDAENYTVIYNLQNGTYRLGNDSCVMNYTSYTNSSSYVRFMYYALFISLIASILF